MSDWPDDGLDTDAELAADERVQPGEKGAQRLRTDKRMKKYLGAKRPTEDDSERVIGYRTEACLGLQKAVKENADAEIIKQLVTETLWAEHYLLTHRPEVIEQLRAAHDQPYCKRCDDEPVDDAGALCEVCQDIEENGPANDDHIRYNAETVQERYERAGEQRRLL